MPLHLIPKLHTVAALGEANKLTQVFRNLMSNAFTFTAKGGSITIALTPRYARTTKHSSVSSDSEDEGPMTELVVNFIDNGAGISQVGDDDDEICIRSLIRAWEI